MGFELTGFSQLSGLRTTIETYIENRADSSFFKMDYCEAAQGAQYPFKAEIYMSIETASRAEYNTIATAIDNQLSSMPTIIAPMLKFRLYETETS
jgi:hypothetical protein